MSNNTTINCPACQSPIAIEPKLLMSGFKFQCANVKCNASVSISTESRQVAKSAYGKFEQLKREL
ncbi:hypothetical protein LRP49_08030 [Enterovibrio sp. ZSDZ35]|uniref:Ogr/Delta-like zinc finger n=1 Tax=Enterovibrio qingdaonensis TaxID=2899818 RepID=A0ABT5QJJ1_9GAMM|nr:hypothetical protein [Enterovibrio sp. ZSDZ35]MDD1781152.1 hypothetical protein [Enterovibrio sp. ZSDZ35]